MPYNGESVPLVSSGIVPHVSTLTQSAEADQVSGALSSLFLAGPFRIQKDLQTNNIFKYAESMNKK